MNKLHEANLQETDLLKVETISNKRSSNISEKKIGPTPKIK